MRSAKASKRLRHEFGEDSEYVEEISVKFVSFVARIFVNRSTSRQTVVVAAENN
jgi:hypothetical protein